MSIPLAATVADNVLIKAYTFGLFLTLVVVLLQAADMEKEKAFKLTTGH